MNLEVVLLVLAVAVLGGIISWLPLCLKARRKRLVPLITSITRAERHLETVRQLPGQISLAQRMADWSQAKETGEGFIRKTWETEFPVPAAPGAQDSLGEIFRSLAATLGSPKLAIAVAGGDQLAQNLFEIVSPEAAGHLADAAAVVFNDGLVQALMETVQAGAGPALMHYATFHGISHVLEHHGLTTEAITHLPAHAFHTLHTASSEALKGAQDVGHHLQHAAAGHSILGLGHSHGGHAGAVVGAHVPWATIILSSLREASLLAEDKTTAGRALTHIAVDAAATGGGALAGAKGGAVAGLFFGPVGAAVGGLLGAVAGALGGRYIAERGKRFRLEALWEKQQAKAREAEYALTISGRTLAISVRNTCSAASKAYQGEISAFPDFNLMAQQDNYQVETSTRLVEGIQLEIEATSREVQAELEAIRIPTATLWEKLLGMDISPKARLLLSEAHQRRQDWAAQVRSSLPRKGSNPYEMYRLLATVPCPRSSNGHFLAADSVAMFPEIFMRAVGSWMAVAAGAYQAGALALDRAVGFEFQRHEAEAVKWRKSIEEIKAEVRRERDALGLS